MSIATRLLVALLALASPLCAQSATVALTDDDQVQLCTVRAFSPSGTFAGVGLGFAHVDVRNLDDRPHAFVVAVVGVEYRGSDVRSFREFVVEGGGAAAFWLPVCMPPSHSLLEVEIDGVTQTVGLGGSNSNGANGLFVSDRPESSPVGLEVMQLLPSALPGNNAQSVCRSEKLPSDWRMFTSFPAVVVDGRANVVGEVQEALRRYAFAGGTVVTLAPEQLPAGPLRELATRLPLQGGRFGAHGLGALAAAPEVSAADDALRRVLRSLPAIGARGFPVNQMFFQEQRIEGLGRAPIEVFVLVIVLFAVLVGPVNFLVLRRRKKPMLALLTVPLAGLGTTVAILLYGAFHDGFGVRGTVTSWTLLDQSRHEAVTVAARTLFAGLAPSALTMQPDVALLSLRAGGDNRDWSDRWHWDADRQRLDGGVLPSRTVTPLVSVQQGTTRERLTVRRVDGDTLEVVPGGGVEPVGEVVLLDFDGGYWLGQGGRLSRVGEREGAAAFDRFVELAVDIRQTAPDGSLRPGTVPTLEPMMFPQPGSYVANVAAAPWLDEHSLAIDYDGRRHLVFGQMDAGDFVQ